MKIKRSNLSKPLSEKQSINPWRFLAYVLLLSWLLWILASQISKFSVVFHYLGGAVPILMTLVFLFTRNNPAERYDFLRRIIDLKRIPGWCWLVILLVVPVGLFISVGLDWYLWGQAPFFERWNELSVDLPSFLLICLFILIFGPVPEEITWRGFVLDKLQSKYPWLVANLLLGLYWMVWHLPLFWIPGSYQNSLGILTPPFWLFLAVLVPQTMVIGWVYNRTQRSTLSAIIIHYFVNLFGELIDLSLRGEILMAAYWWVITLAIVVFSMLKEKNLNRSKINLEI